MRRHQTPLHKLFDITKLKPERVETITPVQHTCAYKPATDIIIPSCKEEALIAAQRNHRRNSISVYCNGSGYEGGIRASAVLYVNQREVAELKYHLGRDSQHMVYEAEIVGLLLAIHLLSNVETTLTQTITIGSDCQVCKYAAT